MDWPVIAACVVMLPAAITAAWFGATLHHRDVTAGRITEKD